MAYKYTVPVNVIPEEKLQEIEKELYEYFHVRAKVEEIISGSFDVPLKIRKDILKILDLPSNINLGYVLEKSTIDSYEIIAIPTDCQDMDFDIA